MPDSAPATTADELLQKLTPARQVSVRDVFGVDSDMKVPAFDSADDHVPEIDPAYQFDPQTTLAICAGFAHDRRVMVQGYHGTGKSTHIEQVAARLNWPLVRVNLDSHVSRIDLVGKDAIVLKDGKQVTEFREGMLPWALQRPIALVFDEYDAGRPDVMFVIQRVLEQHGKLTLLDQNRVIRANPWFRLFSTTNTIGLGDTIGPLSRHPADQSGPDGPLEHRHHAQLPGPRRGAGDRAGQGAGVEHRGRQAHRRRHGPRRRHDPQRLHERRHLHGDEPAHGHDLGPERRPSSPATSALAFRLTFLNKCDELERADGGGVLPAGVRGRSAGGGDAGEGGLDTLVRQQLVALEHRLTVDRGINDGHGAKGLPCTHRQVSRGRDFLRLFVGVRIGISFLIFD